MARSILIVANPQAGLKRRGGLAERCAARVAASGHRAEIAVTEAPWHASTLAREAAARFDVVAALGGDGTVGQVADGLVGGRAALGVLPAGSRNVIARELGLPLNAERVAETLGELPLRPMALGWAAGRHFALCVSAGLDAAVLREAVRRSGGRPDVPSFAAALSGTLLRGGWPRLRVIGEEETLEATVAIVSNTRLYGGYFRATPRASLADDRLHVCVIDSRSRRALLGILVGMVSGRHLRSPGVRYFTCARLRLEAVDEPVDWERDGDLVGSLPVEVEAVPDALRVASLLETGRERSSTFSDALSPSGSPAPGALENSPI